MKKMLCILFILLFGLSEQNITVIAEEPNDLITDTYDYPIIPGSDEWQSYNSLDEKIEATQIPESIVNNMTTSALVESILNYPLLLNMTYFNTFEDGYDSVKSYFYGLYHLESREDAASVLLNSYLSLKEITNESYDMDAFIRYTAIEIMLAQPVYFDSLNEDQLNLLNERIINNYGLAESYSEEVQVEKVAYPFFYRARNEYDGATFLGTMTVYTPKGTAITVDTVPSNTLTSEQIKEYKKWEDIHYPNATRLREPTNCYNCHSYAWYSQATSNIVWMNYPSAYMSDGSYSNATKWSPRVNARIYYPNSNHSGIVTSTAATWSTSTVTSKWGAQSLMRHNATDCPYTYSGARFYMRNN